MQILHIPEDETVWTSWRCVTYCMIATMADCKWICGETRGFSSFIHQRYQRSSLPHCITAMQPASDCLQFQTEYGMESGCQWKPHIHIYWMRMYCAGVIATRQTTTPNMPHTAPHSQLSLSSTLGQAGKKCERVLVGIFGRKERGRQSVERL